MKSIIGPTVHLTGYLAGIFFVIYSYMGLSQLWVGIGGGSSHLFQFEIPLLLIFASLGYFAKIRSRTVKYLLPTVPLIILYLLFDLFYMFLGRSPRFSDLQNIHLISDYSPGMAVSFLLVVLLIPLSIIVLLFFARRGYSGRYFWNSLVLRGVLCMAFISCLASNVFQEGHGQHFSSTSWSQEKTIRENGRFSSFVFFGFQEKEYQKILATYQDDTTDVQNRLFPGPIVTPRNIHLIILESFIDPRLLPDVRYNESPLAQELKKYLLATAEGFSQVVSPVYGGGTTQAEFELLTGLAALAKLSSIEFNVMKGGVASSLLHRLASFNYNAIATVATGSKYYNSRQAYRSMGFREVRFLTETKDFVKVKGDDLIFDGDLLADNLVQVRKHLGKGRGPIFNYVLGMYGHFPYNRNLQRRPDVIEIVGKDETFKRVANQFYYRTKALAEYLQELSRIDPQSLVLVISDHLPPLLNEGAEYIKGNHANIALFLNGGVAEDISGRKYYQLPWLIWDHLTGKPIERNITDTDMETMYFKVLAESIGADAGIRE